METKAHHMLIGVFALAVILSGFFFAAWLSQFKLAREVRTYDIVFKGAVSGLSIAGDVRYNGIKVGEVKEMHLLPSDPNKVLVRIDVDATAPVTQDTVATVEFQGLTGVSYVLLSGGGPKSKALEKKEGEPYPVIASQRSSLQDLFSGAPQMIAKANEALERVNELLSDENRGKVDAILTNTESFTGSLSHSGKDIASLVANLNEASININKFTAKLDKVTTSSDALVTEATATVESIHRVSEGLEAAVVQSDMGSLVSETRTLVRSLDRLAARLESDPSVVLYGTRPSEMELK
jgi:phospholipid/cholesterol/gamma-HCH transport system substrate-binding protein